MVYFIISSKAALQSRGFSSSRWRAGSLCLVCGRGVTRAEIQFPVWLQSPFLLHIIGPFLPALLSIAVCWTPGFDCYREAVITKENTWHLLELWATNAAEVWSKLQFLLSEDLLIRVWVRDAQLFCYSKGLASPHFPASHIFLLH